MRILARRSMVTRAAWNLHAISGNVTGNSVRWHVAKATRKAVTDHRRRQKRKGLERVEVQVSASDAPLIRAVARRLREEAPDSELLRGHLRAATADVPDGAKLRELIFCDLPDEAFEPMLRRDRRPSRRPVDLD
jgi:hypothetical protein